MICKGNKRARNKEERKSGRMEEGYLPILHPSFSSILPFLLAIG
jgi:hypothetical protein